MQRITFVPGPNSGDAKGEATIVNRDATTKEIIVAAQGLKPNATYTVWVVNPQPKMDMAGVGTGDYAFTSDAAGRGQYIGTFLRGEFGEVLCFQAVVRRLDEFKDRHSDIQVAGRIANIALAINV